LSYLMMVLVFLAYLMMVLVFLSINRLWSPMSER
jgi:hypothetical protein